MSYKKLYLVLWGGAFFLSTFSYAQKSTSYDLRQMLAENKLQHGHLPITPMVDGGRLGISCMGIAWLKDKRFSTGVIEVDLRGKDVFQQSFLGVAFHGVDTTTYDAIYFRPFNFKSTDSERRIHAVQYISAPDNHWDRLRKEHNGVYEKAVSPVPEPNDWFHARIEVGNTEIKVYVNGSTTPSLTVNKLNTRTDGLIGLWSTGAGVMGDFANLVIKND